MSNDKLSNMEKMISIPATKMAADDTGVEVHKEDVGECIGGSTCNRETDVCTGEPANDEALREEVFRLKKRITISQWYEKDPALLMVEKAAMNKAFPGFSLERLDDGRLAWTGSLNIGIWGDNVWHIIAVYDNNHPRQVIFGTVRVYLVEPDINELIDGLGWRPSHLYVDSYNQPFLCTVDVHDIKVGREVTSAAVYIAMAVKWLMAFELVLTGDLSKDEFNAEGLI